MKKYQFVFDGTKKLVGYYNKHNKQSSNLHNANANTTSKSTKIIFIFIIVNVILIPIVFFFARRIYMRKKYKANELDSFFENNKNMNENENSMNIEIGLIK